MKNVWSQQKFRSFLLAAILLCSFQYLSFESAGIFSIASVAKAVSPTINFINPTPSDASTQASSSIRVKLQSADENGAHYTFADFDHDLKLWLRMDNIDGGGNPVDSSSYANDATRQGDAQQTDNGKFGKGFNFDGDGDYIQIARPVEDAFTICAWIKTTKAGVGLPHYQTAPVLESEIGEVGYDFGFGVDSNGKMAFGAGGISDITIHGSTTVTDNEWHHVCATRNNIIGTLTVYVDGNQEAAAAGNFGSFNANPEAIIGNGTDGATGFQGTIDDLLVFKRALAAEEILSLYDAVGNQYDHTFSALIDGLHSFIGYSVDALGNMAQTGTRSVTTDSTPPTVSFASVAIASGGSTRLSPVPFTASFDEEVAGFTQGDITVTNATISNFTEVTPGREYSFKVTPLHHGIVTLDIAAAVAQDLVGNNNLAAVTYTFDQPSNRKDSTAVFIPINANQSPLPADSKNNTSAPNSDSNLQTGSLQPSTNTTLEKLQNPENSNADQHVKIEPFKDIIGHWGHDFVLQLYNLKVVQGRKPEKFVPDGNLTRAEAVKIGLLINKFPLDVQTSSGFADLDPNAWYVPYIRKAKAEGFISGTTFRPNEPITRIDALVMLLTMAEKNKLKNFEQTKSSPFKDISQKDSTSLYVNYAYAQGIIIGRGTSGQFFEPNSTITRAEIAKIAIKIKELSPA